MPEIFILFVTDCINTVDELHVLREDRAERKGMDPCAAGFLFFQSRTSCNSRSKGHIVKAVHLLIIGTESHEQKAGKRNMVFLAEVHETFRRFCLKMEDIES